MERGIQYATTADGVSIAFSVRGQGRPLILVAPIGSSTLDFEQLPSTVQYLYGAMGERVSLIRYDPRGSGLSDRDLGRLSMEGLTAEVDAIANRLGLESFDLLGAAAAGPVAIAYAAANPQRVGRLLLWCASASGSDIRSPSRQAIDLLAPHDWRIYTETLASSAFGWANAEDARRLAAILRDSCTLEARDAYYRFIASCDTTPLLARVTAPTLVMHMRDYPLVAADASRRMAARLPRAELQLFPGDSLYPQGAEMVNVLRTIDRFLGGNGALDLPPGPAAVPGFQPGLRTIVFTDVEGSTTLTGQVGDARAREILREHERIVRLALSGHEGCEVKAMGDGFMASFLSASNALECAMDIQRTITAELTPGTGIRVRMGINAGEPIAEGDDLFGTAVNLAARIAGRASGGQIVVADVVRQLVAGRGFLFSDLGDAPVRGFEDAVRLFELRWDGGQDGVLAPLVAGDVWRRAIGR